MTSAPRTGSEGFTLIEVLVAFTILSISFVILLRVFSGDLHQAEDTRSIIIAEELAQSMLERTGIDVPISVGTTEGKFDNGFRWRLTIVPYGDAGDQSALPVAAEKVSVEVHWWSSGNDRSTTLTTLRLAPRGPRS